MDFKFGVLLFVSAYICTSQALPPCVCTRNFLPVCGSDGETYSNACLLDCARHNSKKNLTLVKDAPCDASELPKVCICTYEYSPVCANDGTTYPNECTLGCDIQSKPTLKMSHSGVCNPPPPCVCTDDYTPVCGSDGNTYSNSCTLNCATSQNHKLTIDHDGPCDNKVKIANL